MSHGRLVHHMRKQIYADDSTEDVSLLLKLRMPWLIIGLGIGIIITFVVSRFEAVLDQQVSLAFFIPVIVYMSDAVGTQTETIYIRNLSKKQIKFSIYFFKELAVGLAVGSIAGALLGLFAWVWLGSSSVAITVGLALLASITTAAVVALIIPTILHRGFKVDPAVGAGPFTTVLQDLISLVIYFIIASLIIL